MRPEIPNPKPALDSLHVLYGQFADVRNEFEKAHNESKVWPEWRENQVLNFLSVLEMYAHDLEERYAGKRADSLATTVRNLAEISVWIKYCGESEEKAKIFSYDCVRDMRELAEALQKAYQSENGSPEPAIQQVIDKIRTIATREGIPDYEGKYIQVRDAAKDIGIELVFNSTYKFCSKLAHPTSLMLLTSESGVMLDTLFVSGQKLCVASFNALLTQIQKSYPSVMYRQGQT
jgi:Family of unknown function (DUF5677)